jgi:hypothetical protein
MGVLAKPLSHSGLEAELVESEQQRTVEPAVFASQLLPATVDRLGELLHLRLELIHGVRAELCAVLVNELLFVERHDPLNAELVGQLLQRVPLRRAVDPVCTALNREAERRVIRVDPATEPSARLKERAPHTGGAEHACTLQPRDAGTDDDHVCRGIGPAGMR